MAGNILEFPVKPANEKSEKSRSFVRVATSSWSDRKGMHVKRTIRWLRRRSSPIHLLAEDCAQIGSEEVLDRIVNLDECEDGIYEVKAINFIRDPFSGAIEDYEYELVLKDIENES